MFDKNAFKPISKDEEKKIAASKAELVEQTAQVVKQANEILADEKFIRYRKSFEDLRTMTIYKLHTPIETDPIKDAHYLRACINTLIVLEQILELPQEDIKKGQKQ
jgi:hypothetical protein